MNTSAIESEVRSYCRAFPGTFTTARRSRMRTSDGRECIDLWSGAGALNYGHNDPDIVGAAIDYLQRGGIVHPLDINTEAKRRFLDSLGRIVLVPRNLPHRVQFTGPTGTNSVEAALKLAYLVTSRERVICFENAFHGVTMASLIVGDIPDVKRGAVRGESFAMRYPFATTEESAQETIRQIEQDLERCDEHSLPGAVITEIVQGEGGLDIAHPAFLSGIERLCRKYEMLLIVDEVQSGCGRTGRFFAFENRIQSPDIVCLAKSISGLGLPLGIVLLKPELDVWQPGQHNGTFRSNALSLVAGAASLEKWSNRDFLSAIETNADLLSDRLRRIGKALSIPVVGEGLMQGLRFEVANEAAWNQCELYRRGVVIERCGPEHRVLKCFPALNIPHEDLDEALSLIADTAQSYRERTRHTRSERVA